MSKQDTRLRGIKDAVNGTYNPSGTDVFDKTISIATLGLMDFSRSDEEQEIYKEAHNDTTIAMINSGKK